MRGRLPNRAMMVTTGQYVRQRRAPNGARLCFVWLYLVKVDQRGQGKAAAPPAGLRRRGVPGPIWNRPLQAARQCRRHPRVLAAAWGTAGWGHPALRPPGWLRPSRLVQSAKFVRRGGIYPARGRSRRRGVPGTISGLRAGPYGPVGLRNAPAGAVRASSPTEVCYSAGLRFPGRPRDLAPPQTGPIWNRPLQGVAVLCGLQFPGRPPPLPGCSRLTPPFCPTR